MKHGDTPHRYAFQKAILRLLMSLMFLAFTPTALPQSSPSDLMDLSLEELLNVHIVGRARASTGPEKLNQNRRGVGYSYVRTLFENYQDGSSDLSISEVLTQFPVAPNKIEQEAHVFELTYDATKDMSIVALVPYILQSTKHVRRMGAPFSIDSESVGDIVIQATRTLATQDEHRLTFNGGLSLPTGSIDERGDTPRGKNSQQPYTMQIGSGTFDIIPGLTYTSHADAFDWGGQLKGTIRMGRNGRDYSLGDRLLLTGWLKAQCTESLLTIVKPAFQHWEKIDGADPVLNPTLAHLGDHRADLVVLDMILGDGMDGLETFREYISLFPEGRCVLVSGYTETDRIRETLQLGASAFLHKPYSQDDLARVVQEMLDQA